MSRHEKGQWAFRSETETKEDFKGPVLELMNWTLSYYDWSTWKLKEICVHASKVDKSIQPEYSKMYYENYYGTSFNQEFTYTLYGDTHIILSLQ
jgi:hypothetical protein